ncbi:Hsp20/alpha crystallin family protein [Jongsikchunia kroppenstedtii]|uniref:Hsp20/alpha crystallin family protein n=1 Tax=Jongsikchunia kroppenstedtii TaxID=1121721 RepID=UPI000475CF5B|nr:Hsp20/alpha crystallin family protein [Jongsikchunia kroppenstedtii]
MLRFDPFADVDSLARSMLAGQAAGSLRAPRFMPMDLYKVDDHYVLTADLPGADPGSIDVNVENGVLTLAAQRTSPSDEGVQWLANERQAGSFRRQITLGDSIDPGNIGAHYDNGVLTVTIPLAAHARPHKVSVEHRDRQREISTARKDTG